MKVLAIETSSASGSIAVAENGNLVMEKRFACERGRGTEMFAVLAEWREAWRGSETIAVGIGPGSYNGLRMACALASALQMAGRATLRIAASPCLLPAEDDRYFVCGDARGGRAYRAEVRGRKLVGGIALLSYAEAAVLTRQELPTYRVGPLPESSHLPALAPEAGVLALLAAGLPAIPDGRIEPIYLKPPHITVPRMAATRLATGQ